MTLQNLGNPGEFLRAIGVIATLVISAGSRTRESYRWLKSNAGTQSPSPGSGMTAGPLS